MSSGKRSNILGTVSSRWENETLRGSTKRGFPAGSTMHPYGFSRKQKGGHGGVHCQRYHDDQTRRRFPSPIRGSHNVFPTILIGRDELAVTGALPAVMAVRAGANSVSLFYGRVRDIGYDAASIVGTTH